MNRKNQYAKTTVKRGTSIDTNAMIVGGRDIGNFAFISAVVTKNVPPYASVHLTNRL